MDAVDASCGRSGRCGRGGIPPPFGRRDGLTGCAAGWLRTQDDRDYDLMEDGAASWLRPVGRGRVHDQRPTSNGVRASAGSDGMNEYALRKIAYPPRLMVDFTRIGVRACG